MMRAGLAAFAAALFATAAAAETRTFVIANSPDGYGVDQCLATGARCGTLIATAFCQSKDFAQAASFRRIERAEITGTIPVAAGSTPDDFVAIVCTR